MGIWNKLEEVLSAINSRELKKRIEVNEESSSSGLVVRGRPDHRGFKPKNQHRSKSKFKRKCYIRNSKIHLKRECPERKNKKGETSGFKNHGNNPPES